MKIKNVRFIIAAITTFSAYAVYVSRVNLSIAIIAMVEDHHADHKITHREAVLPSDALETIHKSHIVSDNNPMSDGSAQTKASLPTAHASISTPQDKALDANSTKLHKLSTAFPAAKSPLRSPLIHQLKFRWEQAEQGHILGAFFYGYILFQIPGARMAESIGAKWIIMIANAGSALISLTFPLSTQLNSIYLLMALRFVMGLCQSAFFPAAYVLFCRWLPENERSVLLPIMFIGSNMGSISTYIMSSYLISSSYGWPSVFYLSGLVCSLVTVLWCVFGSNGPGDSWFITEKERQLIEWNVDNQSSEQNSLDGSELPNANDVGQNDLKKNRQNKKNSIQVDSKAPFMLGKLTASTDQQIQQVRPSPATARPKSIAPEPDWPKMLKSVPIWTLILSMYGNEWSNVVICYELPTYLNTALNFPIDQNGVINSFFQLSYTVASPIMSSLGAYMLDKHVLSMKKIHVRKLFQSLATFGQMACFLSVPICGDNRGLIIMFMFSAIVFKACANAGDIMVSGDLSPEYAGTIFAFANSIGNTAGFFAPSLAGAMVKNPYERAQWTPFWLTTATIMGCSGLIFLIFGKTNRQDFSLQSEHKETKENSITISVADAK